MLCAPYVYLAELSAQDLGTDFFCMIVVGLAIFVDVILIVGCFGKSV